MLCVYVCVCVGGGGGVYLPSKTDKPPHPLGVYNGLEGCRLCESFPTFTDATWAHLLGAKPS